MESLGKFIVESLGKFIVTIAKVDNSQYISMLHL